MIMLYPSLTGTYQCFKVYSTIQDTTFRLVENNNDHDHDDTTTT